MVTSGFLWPVLRGRRGQGLGAVGRPSSSRRPSLGPRGVRRRDRPTGSRPNGRRVVTTAEGRAFLARGAGHSYRPGSTGRFTVSLPAPPRQPGLRLHRWAEPSRQAPPAGRLSFQAASARPARTCRTPALDPAFARAAPSPRASVAHARPAPQAPPSPPCPRLAHARSAPQSPCTAPPPPRARVARAARAPRLAHAQAPPLGQWAAPPLICCASAVGVSQSGPRADGASSATRGAPAPALPWLARRPRPASRGALAPPPCRRERAPGCRRRACTVSGGRARAGGVRRGGGLRRGPPGGRGAGLRVGAAGARGCLVFRGAAGCWCRYRPGETGRTRSGTRGRAA